MKFKGRYDLVKSVQRSLGIQADGIDGRITWNAISAALRELREEIGLSSVAEDMVALAQAEIGVSEVDGTNCGKRVNEYKSATWLDPEKGWPWCAAFICWLVREGVKDSSVDFKLPQTAGAWDFENWARDQDGKGVLLHKPIIYGSDPYVRAGDIVVFRFSHIGLAIGQIDKRSHVATIEGNTNDAGGREGGSVLQKKRSIKDIRSVIRIL